MSFSSRRGRAAKRAASIVTLTAVAAWSTGFAAILPLRASATAGVWSGAWTAVTQGGIPVTDEEARSGCDDDTNGGSNVTPDEADIASEADCTGGPANRINPGFAPSMYFAYEQIGGPTTTCSEAADDWMELRLRVAAQPTENPGHTDFKGTIWFWWFDTTGDGVADYYLRLNGANGDTLALTDASFNVLWSQAAPQSRHRKYPLAMTHNLSTLLTYSFQSVPLART
jgi:hypothetical protein